MPYDTSSLQHHIDIKDDAAFFGQLPSQCSSVNEMLAEAEPDMMETMADILQLPGGLSLQTVEHNQFQI